MMPDQSAVSVQPVRMCAVLPKQPQDPYKVTWRIDEIVSADRLHEIVSTARKITGVTNFRPLTDQQTRPHTMFMMEVSARYSERETLEVIDEFDQAVNQAYLAERHQRTLTLDFSSR